MDECDFCERADDLTIGSDVAGETYIACPDHVALARNAANGRRLLASLASTEPGE